MESSKREIEYFYDHEKGITVAKLSGFREDMLSYVRRTFFDYGWLPTSVAKEIMSCPDTFIAKSKYDATDTSIAYSFEEGRELAKNRLLVKVYDKRAQVIEAVYSYFEDKAVDAQATEDWFIRQSENYYDKTEDYLFELKERTTMK